ncbi:electron transfer flavoprotein subunit alpha/FixB family protein [Paenibacillus flagellatus]|uniref:Electron transfer flavoprotein subunit alpha n=1 Tax=Paenibacillus flagellatus TaxID=2211139 RepID=A0A2V5K8L6_9BACL|nr:electron transfer flavoprotein subunit alpha/FixB family protein [Paenibacillus flagellatus]PYI55849.1 electron transfer flavoprotein subunit alpha [Paenibacillus flagellatus]
MSRDILVIAERRDGSLRQVSLEAIAAARTMAGEDGVVHAFVAGDALEPHVRRLLAAGADRVHTAARPAGEPYTAEKAFRDASGVAARIRPAAIVLGHTAIGREVAPRLAAALDAGQLSDVIAIEREPDGDGLRFTRPIYAGKAFEKRVFRREPWVVTIRPNNFPAPAATASDAADSPAVDSAVVPFEPDDVDLRTVVRGVVRRTAGQTDLAEAKIVVSGGRGVKSADGFKPLEELAAALGGAVGASRGACDAGYCDYALQIGQTGKVVTPELYIACGISGAIQHLAGMSQSRVIVAINKDPEAPIFKIADYGIVGDLFEVVPLLSEEVRRLAPPR